MWSITITPGGNFRLAPGWAGGWVRYNRALATSSCIMVLNTKVNVQSMGDRSSRVREYRCDYNRCGYVNTLRLS